MTTEHRVDLDPLTWVVVVAKRVADAQLISLMLVTPAVAEPKDADRRHAQIGRVGNLITQHGSRDQQAAQQLLAAHLLDGVARRHMADLMAQDGGHLGL